MMNSKCGSVNIPSIEPSIWLDLLEYVIKNYETSNVSCEHKNSGEETETRMKMPLMYTEVMFGACFLYLFSSYFQHVLSFY
jgi:hypothetical protein